MDSDPDIEIIEKDSGMSSMGGSKDETPERKTTTPPPPTTGTTTTTATTTTIAKPGAADSENLEDEPDETISERLWGLTEMFPEPVRDITGKIAQFTVKSIKGLYSFSCNASWIFFTSSVILFAPVIFETERAQMEEMQKSQQKQVLLGPGSALAATGPTASLPLIR